MRCAASRSVSPNLKNWIPVPMASNVVMDQTILTVVWRRGASAAKVRWGLFSLLVLEFSL